MVDASGPADVRPTGPEVDGRGVIAMLVDEHAVREHSAAALAIRGRRRCVNKLDSPVRRTCNW
jgi:hypothetical protein